MKNETSAALSPAAREKQRAYNREWNRRNPEKRREINRRYWERKAAEGVKETPVQPCFAHL